MDTDSAGDAAPLTPEEAFAVIGHETRVGILEVLATTDRADRPVSFSALRQGVGDIDSARFNYHLNELVGHFLERTEDGYDFTRPGRRVAQAILSGAVVGNPVSGLTEVEQGCQYCGSPIEVMIHRGRIAMYCTECSGTYLHSNYQAANDDVPDEYGFLGLYDLPPAGMADRDPTEILDRARRWTLLDTLSMASDLCPRCGGGIEGWIDVCEAHDEGERACERCGYRHQVVYSGSCTNCTFDQRVPFGMVLLDEPELQALLASNGVNLVSAGYEAFAAAFDDYDEDVRGRDPFEAVFTFAVGGEELSLTVDDDLAVTEVVR